MSQFSPGLQRPFNVSSLWQNVSWENKQRCLYMLPAPCLSYGNTKQREGGRVGEGEWCRGRGQEWVRDGRPKIGEGEVRGQRSMEHCTIFCRKLAENLGQLFWSDLKNKSVKKKDRNSASILASNHGEAFWCWNIRCDTGKFYKCDRKIRSNDGISFIWRYPCIANITPEKSFAGSFCLFDSFRLSIFW